MTLQDRAALFEEQIAKALPTDGDRLVLSTILERVPVKSRLAYLGEIHAYLMGLKDRPKLTGAQVADALTELLAKHPAPHYGALKAFLKKASPRSTGGSGGGSTPSSLGGMLFHD